MTEEILLRNGEENNRRMIISTTSGLAAGEEFEPQLQAAGVIHIKHVTVARPVGVIPIM